jgi:hypothetical protein
MKCGKGPSDNGNGKSDICPIAFENSANGLNGGTNAGRICWIIANNGCKGKVKCSDLHRENSCFQCEFRYKVIMEEGLLKTCIATGILLSKHETAISSSLHHR